MATFGAKGGQKALSGAFSAPLLGRGRNAVRNLSAQADERTVLITGGNTGMGFITAREMAAKGYRTIIACRDPTKGQAAVQSLQEQNPSGAFELRQLDLSDLSTCKDLGKSMCDEGRPLDVLINNAGVMATPEMSTKDGFEYQLGVNHLGHFALTASLWPMLSHRDRTTRVINVSSDAHLFGDINTQNPNLTGEYNNWKAYGQSKLANVMFTFELAQRVPAEVRVDTNTLHPGVVSTELARYLEPQNPNPIVKNVLLFVRDNFLKTPEQGAATAIHLASSPDVEGVTSKYYVDSKPSRRINGKAFDDNLRKQLWDLSCEMTGVQFDVSSGAAVPA